MRSLLLALLALAPAASAQSIVGRFAVDGHDLGVEGDTYTGTARVTRTGATYQIDWQTRASVRGTGIYTSTGYFAVAFGGPDCSVAVYEKSRDGGTLTGEWTTAGERRLGTEVITRTAPGTYTVQGTTPAGQRYTGAVTVAAHGDTFDLEWTVGDRTFSGTGVRISDYFAVGFGGPSCKVALYEYQNDAFTGVWTTMGGREVGEETLRTP